MQTGEVKPSSQHFDRLRLGATIVTLLILAGSMLLVWLIDDRDAGLIITLVAIVVGWVLTLILAPPSPESPTLIINLDDDNSPS